MVRDHHTPPSPDPAGPGTESKLTHPFSPTPGPWEAIEWSGHAKTTVVARDSENHIVVIAECSGHGRAARECLDDARLIAVAPRLLQFVSEFRAAHRKATRIGLDRAAEIVDLNIEKFKEADAILRELEGGAR